MFRDSPFDSIDNLFRIKVQFRRQAGQVDVIQLICILDGKDFTGKRPTGNQQDTAGLFLRGCQTPFGEGAFLKRTP